MTFLARADVAKPMVVDGRPVLEADSPVVWFTFPGARHDIGRFHDARGRFTALYANILTPVRIEGDDWTTTDLFLDVLLEPGRAPRLLDEDELVEALARGWVDEDTAADARGEAERLMSAARAGSWPPAVVSEWTLDRARAAAGHSPARPGVSRATERTKPEE
mgnify:CR=1 FL=1